MDFPKLKKKVNGFLLNEEGKISKQAAMSVGGALGVMAVGSVASKMAFGEIIMNDNAKCDPELVGTNEDTGHCWAHNNAVNNQYESGVFKSQHQHHYNHTSHSSHNSY